MTGLMAHSRTHDTVQQQDCNQCTILSCELTRQIDAFETLALVNPQLNPELLVQNLRGILSTEVKSDSDLNNHHENCPLGSSHAAVPVSSYDVFPKAESIELGQNDLHELRSFVNNHEDDLVLFNGDDHELTSMTTMTNFYLVEDDIKPSMVEATTSHFADTLSQQSNNTTWATITTPTATITIPKSSLQEVHPETTVNQHVTASCSSQAIGNNNITIKQEQHEPPPPLPTQHQNARKQPTASSKRKSKSQGKGSWKKSKINLESTSSTGSDLNNLLTPDKLKEADQYISMSKILKGGRYINNFECQICHQSLTFSRNARLHVRRVHFNDRLQCEQCLEKFYDYKSLRIHVAKIHGKPMGSAPASVSSSSSAHDDSTQEEPYSNYNSVNANSRFIIQPSPSLSVRNPCENFDLIKTLNVRVLLEPLILPSFSNPTSIILPYSSSVTPKYSRLQTAKRTIKKPNNNSNNNNNNNSSKNSQRRKKTKDKAQEQQQQVQGQLQQQQPSPPQPPPPVHQPQHHQWSFSLSPTSTTPSLILVKDENDVNEVNSSSDNVINFNHSSISSASFLENHSDLFPSSHFQIIISNPNDSNITSTSSTSSILSSSNLDTLNLSTSTLTSMSMSSPSCSTSTSTLNLNNDSNSNNNYDTYENIYTTVEDSSSAGSSEFPTVDLDVLRALCM